MNAQSSDGGVGGREGVKYALLPFPLAFGSWTIVREWKGKVIMRLEMALSATSQFFIYFFRLSFDPADLYAIQHGFSHRYAR